MRAESYPSDDDREPKTDHPVPGDDPEREIHEAPLRRPIVSFSNRRAVHSTFTATGRWRVIQGGRTESADETSADSGTAGGL